MREKKIGFLLSTAELRERQIINELEQLLNSRARVSIALYEGEQPEKTTANELLCRMNAALEFGKKGGDAGNAAAPSPGSAKSEGEPLGLDLLVVITGSEKLFAALAGTPFQIGGSPPLLLAPLLETVTPPVLRSISALLNQRGVFFVPFGPAERPPKRSGTPPGLYSRLDLLAEACAAALAGKQLRPVTWEICPMPPIE